MSSLKLKNQAYNIRGKLLLPIGLIVFSCITIIISWYVLPQGRHLVEQLYPEFYTFTGLISISFLILVVMERYK